VDKPLSGIFFKEQAELLGRKEQVGVLAVVYRTVRSFKIKNGFFLKSYVIKDSNITTFYKEIFHIPFLKFINQKFYNYCVYNSFNSYKKLYGKPNLILVQSIVVSGDIAMKISESENIPYIIVEHASEFLTFKKNNSSFLKYHKIFEKAKLRFSVSEYFSKILNEIFQLDFYTSYNFIDETFWNFQYNESHKKDSKVSILCVANLVEIKGLDILLKSFSNVVKKISNVHLKIVGVGSEEPNLRKMVVDFNLNDNVEFLGSKSRDELKLLYNDCDIFVLPSRFETFGIVLIEALAIGKPIISSNTPGGLTIVNEINGLTFPVGDILKLEESILLMVTNLKNYDPLMIRKDFENRFSSSIILDNLLTKIRAFGINE